MKRARRATSQTSKSKIVRPKPPRKRDVARRHLIQKIAEHPKVTKRAAQRGLILLELQSSKRTGRGRKMRLGHLVDCYASISASRPRLRKASKHEVQVPTSTVLKALGKEYETRLIGT